MSNILHPLKPAEFLRAWFERVWNQGDETAIYELQHPECKSVGAGEPMIGPDAFVHFHRRFLTVFAEVETEVIECVEEGEAVMGYVRMRALHRPSGKRVELMVSVFGHVVGNQFIYARNLLDTAGLLMQLGELAPADVERLFGGGDDNQALKQQYL